MPTLAWTNKAAWIENPNCTPEQQQKAGILCFLNVMGTPSPVSGLTDENGVMWRVINSTLVEDGTKPPIMTFESETGEHVTLTQQEAVQKWGQQANRVFNPIREVRSNMGIDAVVVEQKAFPDSPDF